MSNWKDWDELRNSTEVCEKNGKYYLKAHPERLYETHEEASQISKGIRDMIVF